MKEFEVESSTIECPVYDVSCPYCDVAGSCHLRHPMQDCDDYAAYHEE